VRAELRREPGGNLLVVGREGADDTADTGAAGGDNDSASVLYALVAGLVSAGAQIDLVDFLGLDSRLSERLGLVQLPGFTFVRPRATARSLEALGKLVEERKATSDYRAPTRALVLAGLQRARDFEPFGPPDGPGELLATLLREGPEVGVHVIASVDKAASLSRRFDGGTLREFGVRLLYKMSKEDSFKLADSEAAARINSFQLVMDDADRGLAVKLRPFAPPGIDWLTDVAAARGGVSP
jgi:hypothetical protein